MADVLAALVRLLRRPPDPEAPHRHYCQEHDLRWRCITARCLLHYFTPCPDRLHLDPAPAPQRRRLDETNGHRDLPAHH